MQIKIEPNTVMDNDFRHFTYAWFLSLILRPKSWFQVFCVVPFRSSEKFSELFVEHQISLQIKFQYHFSGLFRLNPILKANLEAYEYAKKNADTSRVHCNWA